MGFMRACALLCLALLVVGSPPTLAETEDAPDFEAAALTGNWGGKRDDAWRAGWSFDATITVDLLRNRGGLKNGSGVLSDVDVRVRADLEKLAGWTGATAYLNILDDRGDAFNTLYAGTLKGVSNIEVAAPSTRVFQAWIQQNFFDDQFSLLAGLYPIDSEFFAMESAASLIHPTFGTSGDLALTHVPAVFNNSALGLRAKWLARDRTLYGMAAVLDGVAGDPANPQRNSVKLGNGDGVFVIGEFGWMPLEYGHTFEPVEPVGTLPGETLYRHERYGGVSKYAIGYWRYSSPPPDQYQTGPDGEPAQGHAYGAYALAERTLFGLDGPGRDVSVFGRYSWSNGLATAVDQTWNVGVRVRGPLASRPNDELLLGAVFGHLSSGFRAAQAAAGIATVVNGNVVEVSWRAALTRYVAVQPLFQSSGNPGGATDARRANVFGVRLELVL